MKSKVGVAFLLFATSTVAAESKGLEAAQLVTYVKPTVPAGTDSGTTHTVGFKAVLGADGKLRDFAAMQPDAMYEDAARTAATQWVYTPFKRKGQPLERNVYLTVAFGPQEHTTDPKQPVLLSTRLMAELVEKRSEPASPVPGRRAMVVVRSTVGKDGSVEDAKAVSGPPQLTDVAERAARQWTFRPVLLDGVPVEVGTVLQVIFSR